MAATIFDSISHADFLRLTLEALSRQGFAVEPSSAAGADAVLVGKSGTRTGILCKKYRGALIGRPVLQQFHEAMTRLRCTEGYLITTTDCTPEAYDFAAGKGMVLYSRERTEELLRTAFGDGIIRTGRMPLLGAAATAGPPAANRTVSVASYEKGAASDLKKARETGEPPEPVQAPEPEEAPAPERSLPAETTEELPEEVLEVESIAPPGVPDAAPPERTTIIVCLECNNQLRVPIDQGIITVACPECGMRRLYQPELDDNGELKTTTVTTCRSCSQRLNIPTNRGQLKVRCPQCKAEWLFTP